MLWRSGAWEAGTEAKHALERNERHFVLVKKAGISGLQRENSRHGESALRKRLSVMSRKLGALQLWIRYDSLNF